MKLRRTTIAATAVVAAVGLAACGGSGGSSGGSGGAFKIGIKFDQPGMGLKEGAKYTGFDVDVARYVAHQLGHKDSDIQFVEAPTPQRETLISTGQVNYVGPIKLVDHKGEQADDQGDGTVVDAANGLLWNYDGTSGLNCGTFSLSGQPYHGCTLPSFTTFDVFGKWTVMKNLDINFSVQNLFDRQAPFDPYLVLTYGNNYNQGWHQAGAVGRFYTVGARYTF
jgi:hypothetical protein